MLCDIHGQWVKKGETMQFEPLADSQSRWEAKEIREHFENLILPSGKSFRAKKEAIRDKLEIFRT